jgi:hypothetical protein
MNLKVGQFGRKSPDREVGKVWIMWGEGEEDQNMLYVYVQRQHNETQHKRCLKMGGGVEGRGIQWRGELVQSSL